MSFFTGIQSSSWFFNGVEEYFHLWGQRGKAQPNLEVKPRETRLSSFDLVLTPLKLATYSVVFYKYYPKQIQDLPKKLRITIHMRLQKAIQGAPAFLLVTKCIHRIHLPYFTYTEEIERRMTEELASGITITKEMTDAITKNKEAIFSEKNNQEIKIFSSQRGHRVFQLRSHLNLIFKTAKKEKKESVYQRIKSHARAYFFVKRREFSQLKVPNAKLFEIEGHPYIAEEKLDIEPGIHESRYIELKDEIEPQMKELATFILDAGYWDVAFRNIPILKNRQIGLVDLEELETYSHSCAQRGCLGRSINGVPGLLGCITPALGEKIVQFLRHHPAWAWDQEAESALARRRDLDRQYTSLNTWLHFKKTPTSPPVTLFLNSKEHIIATSILKALESRHKELSSYKSCPPSEYYVAAEALVTKEHSRDSILAVADKLADNEVIHHVSRDHWLAAGPAIFG